MGWKFEYEAPPGFRFNKDVFDGFNAYPIEGSDHLWFCGETRKFKKFEECKGVISSCGHGINSVKAFKRYVKKHCSHMRNYEITLCSRIYFTDNDGNEFGVNVSAKFE